MKINAAKFDKAGVAHCESRTETIAALLKLGHDSVTAFQMLAEAFQQGSFDDGFTRIVSDGDNKFRVMDKTVEDFGPVR